MHRDFAHDRELFAIFTAIKHFKHGRPLTIFTEHKPINFVFELKLVNISATQGQYLSSIAQFITDIQYITANENTVEDSLSRIGWLYLCTSLIDYNCRTNTYLTR